MSRLAVSLLLVASVVVACQGADQGATITTDGQGATSTTNGGTTCVDPPVSELEVDSPLDLTVEPNPVMAGDPAMLSIGMGTYRRTPMSGRVRGGNAGRERPGSTPIRWCGLSRRDMAKPSK